MPRLQKARPFSRDKAQFRDDRLYIIACCDRYAPDQYFDFFRFHRIQVHVVPTIDGTSTPERVLDRLLEVEHYAGDERWMMLDTDHITQGTHLRGTKAALKRAADNDIKVAFSRPCFELWLLLHHLPEDDVTRLANATEVNAKLQIALGAYDKTRLKKEHFPVSRVRDACSRAQKLDSATRDQAIPDQNTSRVYKLWYSIVSKSSPWDLPEELRALRDSMVPSR